jgi:hypothetical protein
MPSPLLRRTAKWLALLAVLGLVAVAAYMGSPGDPEWWLAAPIFIAWQAGPILLATACAHASRDVAGQRIFLLLAFAFIVYTTFVYADVLRSTNSTAAVALAFYPLFEYPAWVLVFGIASAFRWRYREDWLKDKE